MEFILLIFLLGMIDRMRETTIFGRWYKNSWMFRVKDKFWHRWLRSRAVDKWRPLGFDIPQIFDAYHASKALSGVLLIGYHVYSSGCYWYILWDVTAFGLAQYLFEGSDEKNE